jgi:hypothetical protein
MDMSTLTPADINSQIRDVTPDEVASYDEQGWTLLPGLVSPGLAGELLDHLKNVSGLHHDQLAEDDPDAPEVMEMLRANGIFKLFSMPRLQDETVREIVTSRGLGRAAATLSGHPSMRINSDGIICKMPAWIGEKNLLEGPGADVYTAETPWHQDYPQVPWDRGGAVQFWMALAEVTPEMGSLQYLTGSHREPPLGAIHYTHTDGGQTLEGLYPELWEKYEVSPGLHLQAGDVLAHNSLVVHYAEPNRTDRLRWAYTSYRMPAHTLYNGVPFKRFIEWGIDLKQWEPFDHPAFPIVTG